MKATDLFNQRKEEFETTESFAKRVYETAKRYNSSLIFTPQESYHVLTILAKYYKETAYEILSVIRNLEYTECSKKYRIQWVKCLDSHIVSYRTIYQLCYSQAQRRYCGIKLLSVPSNYTLRGRWMALSADEINKWLGYELLISA